MKKVQFNNNIKINNTYSYNEYDRSCIDHVLYRRTFNKITDSEFRNIYITLDIYKLYDMPVHTQSLKNNSYYIKKFFG